jgi:tRNA pseudouridine38-40 synthase
VTAAQERRLALLIEYHGAGYFGSQRQKAEPTIQSELEAALLRLTSQPVRVSFAGRTDAGVHALGQVASFTTTTRHRTGVFVRGLNALLPGSIAVRAAREVDSSFDPRRDALSRTYRYAIHNGTERSPILADRSWHIPRPLDLQAMREAAGALVGEHDFAAFSRREPTSTVRSMASCHLAPCGRLVTIEVKANAFLRHQVRRTAGALAQVALGKLSIEAFRGLLAQAEPATAGPVAPAQGLTMISVAYPDLDLSPQARYDT